MVDKFKNIIGDTYRDIAKGFMTVLKESRFYEEGVLTPEEFTNAGDYLTTRCPTWKWCSNKNGITSVEYLDKNKQFLITTVPCLERAKSMNTELFKEETVESDWLDTTYTDNKSKNHGEDLIEIDISNMDLNENQVKVNVINTKEDYLDMGIEHISDINTAVEGEPIIIEVVESFKKSRTYEVTITYDFYYRVPRMWLTGYGELNELLSDDEIKQDIMLDYIDKTVTLEKHPNTGIKSVSIHPCRHSILLKKMISNFEKVGKKLDAEKSIVLFLKFLSSVVPTIKYDFTMDLEF